MKSLTCGHPGHSLFGFTSRSLIEETSLESLVKVSECEMHPTLTFLLLTDLARDLSMNALCDQW